MTTIRRFFDAVATDAPGVEAPVNIAQLLASKGVQTEGETTVEIPSITIEEPKLGSPEPEAPKPSAEPAKAETAAPATAKPEEPAKPQDKPAAPAPVAPAPAADWKEVLKNHPDHTEVLKTLGFDEKIVSFIQRWKGGEDIKDYLEAITLDYTKLSPEDLMKRQLRRDYPEIEGTDFDELYRMKVIEQYKLDPDIFNEQDVRRGKILLQADARKLREQFVKDQQQFILPKAPEVDPQVEQQRQEALRQQEEQQKQFDQYRSYITGHNLTKDFMTSKMLTFGEGDEAFKYEVEDPAALVDMLFDSAKVSEKLFDEVDGQRTPNVFKHLFMAAILNNDADLITNLAKHFKKVGSKKLVDTIENASLPGAQTTHDAENADPIAALARAGIITGGG